MDEVYLTLQSEEIGVMGAEFLLELSSILKPSGVRVCLYSKELLLRNEGPALARKIGITRFLLNGQLCESIMAGDNPSDALDILALYVNELDPVDSFTIIDPYFFASASIPIIPRFDKVIGPILPSIKELKVIYSRRPDNLSLLTSHIAATSPHVRFTTEIQSDIHDRFWIADKARGLVVGTSLNSFGSKFCFVERLSDQDVKDVIKELLRIGTVF